MPARLPARLLARPRVAVALLLLVPLSCQNPFPGPGHDSGSRGPLGPLAAADQQFFAGDYDGAEQTYQRLISSNTPDAQAHYALLLTYESRFREAVAAGTAAVGKNADSASLARLTRVYDWSEDLPLAVATGRRAVSTSPVDPLAHVFYAEALADYGQFDNARGELRQAAAVKSQDAYFKSEVDREWANYYRDGGDVKAEFQHFDRSFREFSAFPERKLELARYYYSPDGHNPEQGRKLLNQVAHSYAHRYGVLVSAALVALLGPDNDEATSLYHRALQLAPGGPDAALGMAEILVAQRRDFRAAHDLLLGAFKAHSDATDVYLFLRFLDTLVLKVDPDRDIGTPEPQSVRSQLAAQRTEALDRVNAYRAGVGLPGVRQDAALDEGAEAHSFYFLFNFGSKSESGLGVHREDATLPGFTGENGLLRGRHFGYPGLRGSEVINHVFTPHGAVQVWVDSVYHRFPILDPETQVAGFGGAAVGPLSIQVMDMGLGDPASSPPVVYPYPNQQDVPSAFLGNELPNPLPSDVNHPVGYPVTLEVGGADQLNVTQGRLLGPTGSEVPSYVLNPGTQSQDQTEWSLLAQAPLQAGVTYTVEVTGQLNGARFTKRWSFRVAGAQGILE